MKYTAALLAAVAAVPLVSAQGAASSTAAASSSAAAASSSAAAASSSAAAASSSVAAASSSAAAASSSVAAASSSVAAASSSVAAASSSAAASSMAAMSSSSSSSRSSSSRSSTRTTSSETTSSTSSTSSSSSMSSSSTSASASASASAGTFVVQVATGGNTRFQRRQAAGGYIAADGSLVDACTAAASFTITPAGQLESNGGFVSTDGTVPNALFVALNPPLAISTLWTGNPVRWTNAAFAGGAASFCTVNGQVYSVFQTAPAGCTPVTLGRVPTTGCVDINGGGAGTVTNIAYNGDVYNVNGSFYSNSFNNNGNDNNDVSVNGDGNNVNAGDDNAIVSGGYVSVQSVLPSDIWSQFQNGSINYYCSDDHYYYAKFCASCQVVPVEKTAGGDCYYIDTNGQVLCVPAFYPSQMTSATPAGNYSAAQCGVVTYAKAYCVDKCASTAVSSSVEYCAECEMMTTVTAPHSTGEALIATTVPAGSSSAVVVMPSASATPGAEVACDECGEGSKTLTVPPTGPTGTSTTPAVVPFTGGATKKTIGGSAIVAFFGLLLL